jgi:hypothetical protein
MSGLSWIKVFNGRFVTVVQMIGDHVVVSISGEQAVMTLADWRNLPRAI